MSCLGVHFAITQAQREALLALSDDDARIDYVQMEIERDWDPEFAQASDKAWDAMHRCLSDWPPETPHFYPVDPQYGTYALPEDHGDLSLKLCVLGGRKVTDDESVYFIRLIEPEEVTALVPALARIDKPWMREKYFTHCRGAWPEYGEEDFEYTWVHFEEVRDFFKRMNGNGRSVIFTADQ